MRLFTALDLPDDAKERITKLQEPGLEVSWISPETMHLTLRFIGDADRDVMKRLSGRFSNIGHPAFALQVKGVGYFPARGKPKVIWAGVGENSKLMRLQEKIEQACRMAGLDPEERTFTPHITLGRVKGASRKEVLTFINRNKKLRIDDIFLREFILYESRLHTDGAIHSPLERFPLDTEEERTG